MNRTPGAASSRFSCSRWSSEPMPVVPSVTVSGSFRAAGQQVLQARCGELAATQRPLGSSTTLAM
jgi:hypothetical protein